MKLTPSTLILLLLTSLLLSAHSHPTKADEPIARFQELRINAPDSLRLKYAIASTTYKADPPLVGTGCLVYPMAARRSGVEAAPLDSRIDILDGAGPADHGWLIWNSGEDDESYLLAQINQPELSLNDYTNPAAPSDHLLSVGDYVATFSGVPNSIDIRDSLFSLVGRSLIVPVWDDFDPDGFKRFPNPDSPPSQVDAYKIWDFIWVRIESEDDIQITLDKDIYATYLGPAEVAPCPYLSLIQTGPLSATANSLITYTLTVTNSGNLTATNLLLSSAIPDNAAYVSGGSLAGGLVQWSIPSLDYTGGSNTLSRTFSVKASQTITSDSYQVSADNGISATGVISVVTMIEGGVPVLPGVYLPVILKAP